MNVSVVIPTLNEEGNLPKCLEALKRQMKSGDEVIVVDGGSEDSTVDIAVDYGCDVYLAEGSSIGRARNIGTEKASNEIIAQTDADAIPPNGWVSRIRDHFESDDELVVLWGSIEDVNGVPIRNLVGKFSTVVGGASGNNTAYRKSAFEEVKGYPDISFSEDVFMIGKLATVGKAKRDKELVMVMNMDRKRYQTHPCVWLGGSSVVLGRKIGGRIGRALEGAGLSLVCTEFTYEDMTGSPLHHDQVGSGIVALGNEMKSEGGDRMMGAGAGIIAHHVMTEGLSLLPTELERNTNIVMGG